MSLIFPVRIRDNKRVKNLSARLLEMGIYAIGICYPAVRDKDARIRISILAPTRKMTSSGCHQHLRQY